MLRTKWLLHVGVVETYSYRIFELCAAILMTRVAGQILFPFVGILLKWLIMGRARPGAYDLWGHVYLRRQFTQQMLKVGDLGYRA